MHCSVGKSGSNWLDRLRSSKGFPTGGDLSLDHFLNNHNPNPSSNSSLSGPLASKSGPTRSEENPVRQPNQPPEILPGEEEWFGIMTNVLSELFNMDDSDKNPTFSRKKSSRKQTNPKICIVPSSESIESKNVERIDEGNEECLDGEDEKSNGGDLLRLGYSRTEVTVIDTSCSSWKFDKLLFRKKNVWKVREKKRRHENVGRKKRKAIPSDEDVGGKKTVKLSISPFHDDHHNGADCTVPLNEDQNLQNDKREETFLETPNIPGQVPEKRFSFPRSTRKTTKGGASGIHMKGVRAVREISLEAGIQQRDRPSSALIDNSRLDQSST